MREIIYRCFDKEEDKFVYSNQSPSEYEFVFEDETIVCVKGYERCDSWGICYTDWIKLDCDVEQDTGLKDMNGNRIFEGDKVIYDMDEFGYIGFCSGQFCFSGDDGFQSGLLWDDCSNEFEVIGNVHQ